MYLSRYINFPDSPGSSCLLLQYNSALHLAPPYLGSSVFILLLKHLPRNYYYRQYVFESEMNLIYALLCRQAKSEKNGTFMTMFLTLIFIYSRALFKAPP